MLGPLVTGIAIGPFAPGWIPDSEEERYLAEFGVVFLMFSIDLEFCLPRLNTVLVTPGAAAAGHSLEELALAGCWRKWWRSGARGSRGWIPGPIPGSRRATCWCCAPPPMDWRRRSSGC